MSRKREKRDGGKRLIERRDSGGEGRREVLKKKKNLLFSFIIPTFAFIIGKSPILIRMLDMNYIMKLTSVKRP